MMNSPSYKKNFVLLTLFFVFISVSKCFSQVQITISKKFAPKVAIAIPAFENQGNAGTRVSAMLAQQLRYDLDASGYFACLKNQGFVDETEKDDRESGRINLREWSALKAEMVLKSHYVVQGEKLSVSCRLYSVSNAQVVFSRNYSGTSGEATELVHRIANDIIKAVTGEAGLCGSRIAFVSDASGLKQLYLMEFGADRARKITGGKNISIFPDWAPDGKSLVFTSYVRNFPEIFIMDLTTRKARSLASFAGLNAFADISPDGNDMLLALSKAGNPELYRMNLKSGNLTRLTRSNWVESSPCWSPDGNQIAFVSDKSGSPQIYVMDSWGKTKPTRITFEGSYNTKPDWSPNGDMIVYSSQKGRRFEIRLLDLKTKQDVALPKTGFSDENPSWAPDGRHIVYSSEKNRKSDIYVMDIYEQVPRQITQGKGNFTTPSWSP
jgi:TolB protein